MPTTQRNKLFFWGSIVLLLISTLSVFYVPRAYKSWGAIWGLDLQNVHAFETCKTEGNPYQFTGDDCGDWDHRYLPYPPLLFYSFYWTKFFTMKQLYPLWVALILSLTSVCTFLILQKDRPSLFSSWPLWACLWLLLLCQFPMTFALERGNNDVGVIVIWTCALLAWLRKKWFLTGFFMGTAVAYKLYPLLAMASILGGLGLLLFTQRKLAKTIVLMLCGIALSIYLFTYGLWPATSHTYFTLIMPGYSHYGSGVWHYTHSLSRTFEGRFWIPALIIRFTLLGCWVWATKQRLQSDAVLVFTGALALSTYFTGTSYDYNLITTYPLLMVLAVRGQWALFFWGCLGICGFRGAFVKTPVLLPLLQISWLCAVALWAQRLQKRLYFCETNT